MNHISLLGITDGLPIVQILFFPLIFACNNAFCAFWIKVDPSAAFSG
jgi:hypothetical protein